MFKINIYLKFALIALFLIGGIVLASIYGFWYAFPLILIGLGLLASYFLLGTIQSAAEFLQLQQFDQVKARLALTKFPGLLYNPNRAFYYMMKGTLAMNDKDTETAETFLTKAKSIKMSSDNERAVVDLQLANIYAEKGNWSKAKAIYREIKELDISEAQIKMQIDQFGKALKQSGNIKTAQRMQRGGMHMGGGKRRRPRMR